LSYGGNQKTTVGGMQSSRLKKAGLACCSATLLTLGRRLKTPVYDWNVQCCHHKNIRSSAI